MSLLEEKTKNAISAIRKFESADRKALDAAIFAGEQLNKLKQSVAHGQWEQYIRANIPRSSKSVRDLLFAYKHRSYLEPFLADSRSRGLYPFLTYVRGKLDPTKKVRVIDNPLGAHVYLYLLFSPAGSVLKVGHAKNPEARGYHFRTLPEIEKRLILSIPFPTVGEAKNREEEVRTIFASSRLSMGEARDFGIGNGFTECFPVSLLSALIQELSFPQQKNENEEVLEWLLTSQA